MLAIFGVAATFSVLTDAERRALPAWCQGAHVKRVDAWFADHDGNSVRFAQWDHPSEGVHQFTRGLYTGLERILPVGAIAVDIGAHSGDTTLPIALATRGGRTFAFEMGPPYSMLRCNLDLNPSLRVEAHNLAVSDRDGEVLYESGCGGCNGGITSEGSTAKGRAKSVRLSSALPTSVLGNISFIKIDTEGHDLVILRDLKQLIQRSYPKIIVEWYTHFQDDQASACSDLSMQLFNAIASIGYQALAVSSMDVAGALRTVRVMEPKRVKGRWECPKANSAGEVANDLLLWPLHVPLPKHTHNGQPRMGAKQGFWWG